MGKYASLHSDVYSVFAQVDWTAENIKTIPANYSTLNLGNEFIRVNIIPTGHLANVGISHSLSGLLILDIFVPAGNGLNRLSVIADKLDTYLVKKTIATTLGGNTQFSESSLNPIGLDSANASLYRAGYSINFNYFGK